MIYLNIASEFSDEVFFFKPASESWLYKTSKISEILFSFRPWSDFFRNYWLAFFHQSRNRETRSQNFEGSKVLKKCFIFVSHSHFRSFLLWLLVWLLPSRSQSKTLDVFTCFSTEKSFLKIYHRTFSASIENPEVVLEHSIGKTFFDLWLKFLIVGGFRNVLSIWNHLDV